MGAMLAVACIGGGAAYAGYKINQASETVSDQINTTSDHYSKKLDQSVETISDSLKKLLKLLKGTDWQNQTYQMAI